MTRLDKLIKAAKIATGQIDTDWGEVVLTYEDGSKKTMLIGEAITEIAKTNDTPDCPHIVAMDQPPGSLLWALFASDGLQYEGDAV